MVQTRSWPIRYTTVLALPLALLAAGCGGEDNNAGPPTSGAPPPSPTPAPTPTPTQAAFGTLGQTSSQSYAVLSYSFGGTQGGFGINPDPTSFAVSNDLGLRLAAPSDLFLSVASLGEGKMVPNGASGTNSNLGLTLQGYNVLNGSVTLQLELGPGGNSTLKSTARGYWEGLDQPGATNPYRAFDFVYGIPTSAGAIPQTGTIAYSSFDKPVVTIDFASKLISGSITTGEEKAPITYVMSDGILAADGTFHATLRASGISRDGLIEGRLTGDAGQELMLRLTLPQADGTTVYSVRAGYRV